MAHVVLLGDSVFDNGAYTSGGPDVVTQRRQLLPPGWRASLAAVDGDTTVQVARQLENLPEPSSAGGEKIARAVAAVVTGDALRTPATRVTLA